METDRMIGTKTTPTLMFLKQPHVVMQLIQTTFGGHQILMEGAEIFSNSSHTY